jgi:hypothetical protein
MAIHAASGRQMSTGDSSHVSFLSGSPVRLHCPPLGLPASYSLLVKAQDVAREIMKIDGRLSKADTVKRSLSGQIAPGGLATRAPLCAHPCRSEYKLRALRHLRRQARVLFGARGPPGESNECDQHAATFVGFRPTFEHARARFTRGRGLHSATQRRFRIRRTRPPLGYVEEGSHSGRPCPDPRAQGVRNSVAASAEIQRT